jgi:large subunit ribosomal protein L4e
MILKASVIEMNGELRKKIELPELFSLPLRPDLVSRTFWLLHSHSLQPYGRDTMAGERTSAVSWQTGRGVARVPRVKGDRHPRAGQAAGVASVVKGRLAHPPKSEKVIFHKINKKEKRMALNYAIAFTGNRDAVISRGHKIAKINTPIVVSDEIERISKTSELKSFLLKLGLEEELKRLYGGIKKQSGKARMRGRSYRERKGPLIVVTNKRGIDKAASSIPGVDVVSIDDLSVLQLAPGGVSGRLTLWTESSIEMLRSKEESKIEA